MMHALNLLIVLLACLLTGCMILPVPTLEHGLDRGRGRIDTGALGSMMERGATREDVLLQFAEPTESLCGDQIFIYEWRVIGGYLDITFGLGPGMAGGVDLPLHKTHLAMLQFDQRNRLMRWDHFTTWAIGSVAKGAAGMSFEGIFTVPSRVMPQRRAEKTKQSEFLKWASLACELPSWLPPTGPPIVVSPKWSVPPIATPSSQQLRVRVTYVENNDIPHRSNILVRIGPEEVSWISLPVQNRDVLTEAIAAQVKASNHLLVGEGEDVRINCDLIDFKIGTAWDDDAFVNAAAKVDVELQVMPTGSADSLARRYRSEAKERIVPFADRRLPYESAPYESVLTSAIEGVLTQIATDAELAEYLSRVKSLAGP